MPDRTEPHRVALDVFEGPLDLLLYLIRRDEVDIYDIPIESITRQYLEHLEQLRFLDLDVAGEFLVMAATLMMIKSRMLLPVAAAGEEALDAGDIDPRLDLVRQLVEYKKFKDVASHLLSCESHHSDAFPPRVADVSIPGLQAGDEAWSLGDVGLFDLLAAFEAVLRRASPEPFEFLEPIRWSVTACMTAILKRTRRGGRTAFFSLFDAQAPRGQIVATFLALLELLRGGRILAFQDCEFGEIMLEASAAEAASIPDCGVPDARPAGVEDAVYGG